MQTFENSVGAGTTWRVNVLGNYFRLLSTDSPVSIVFYSNGGSVESVIENVEAGFAVELETPFDSIAITSPGAQSVKFGAGRGRMAYDRTIGTVALNAGAATVQTPETVTNIAANMIAANPNRRFLLIQNNSATGDIFIDVAGNPATLFGIKIPAGSGLLFDVFVPTAAISAIGTIASNPNVVVIEG